MIQLCFGAFLTYAGILGLSNHTGSGSVDGIMIVLGLAFVAGGLAKRINKKTRRLGGQTPDKSLGGALLQRQQLQQQQQPAPQQPAAWYPNPDGSGDWRWWDGKQWTVAHTSDPEFGGNGNANKDQ